MPKTDQIDEAAEQAAINHIRWNDDDAVTEANAHMKARPWAVVFTQHGNGQEFARFESETQAQSYAVRHWAQGRANRDFTSGGEDRAAWSVVYEPAPDQSEVRQVYRADEQI